MAAAALSIAPTLPVLQTLDLRIPSPKMLTLKEELELARRAYASDPASERLFHGLVSLLVRLDYFEEAITLLQARGAYDFRSLTMLHSALMSRQTEAGTLLAREAAERAVQAATFPRQRAEAISELAKTYMRLGDNDSAARLLTEALEENPEDKDAFKRLFKIYLDSDPQKALAFARSMIARGIVHARVLGAVPLALAKLGRVQDAHVAEGFDEFLLQTEPGAPQGWGSLDEFNAALAQEILDHPDMRYERYNTASTKTWRVDEPSLHRSRIFSQLQKLIRAEVMDYIERLPPGTHPLLQARPQQALLRNWVVVTQGEGHETWHVHQNGWMSGVYYVHVQDHIVNGTGPEGCIAFGLSDELAGEQAAAAYGERLMRPRSGLMMMFPSHSFHRTYPHYGPGHRICFAFDIIPVSA